ncbi:MAG: signal peptidase II [Proteobacteria bacterium]|nr:signal peptidase II [Pseudomonadota bacterium]
MPCAPFGAKEAAERKYHACLRRRQGIRLSPLPKPNALVWLLLSASVIGLDQITKAVVRHALVPYMPHEVIPHVLNWTLAFNRGAAFSFLSDSSGWQVWLFGILAVVVCIGLIVWLARTPRADWRTALPVALVIGGALGNLIDRLVHGQVTDFIQVYWHAWSWPAFNVADSAITVGAVILIAFGLLGGHASRTPQQ